MVKKVKSVPYLLDVRMMLFLFFEELCDCSASPVLTPYLMLRKMRKLYFRYDVCITGSFLFEFTGQLVSRCKAV